MCLLNNKLLVVQKTQVDGRYQEWKEYKESLNHKNLYRSVESADLTTSNEYKQVPVLTATCKYPQVGLYCIYVGLNI